GPQANRGGKENRPCRASSPRRGRGSNSTAGGAPQPAAAPILQQCGREPITHRSTVASLRQETRCERTQQTRLRHRHGGRRAGAGRSRLADSRIDVLVSEPIGTIAPELYGHFVEHLGGVVYDGVWVGEKSRIPNIGGLRQTLVDAFRLIHPGVVRWPGGCFADSYDWHDGVGPRERRPRRTNFWSDDPHLRALGDVPAKYD